MAKISNVERINGMVARAIMQEFCTLYPMAQYADQIDTAQRMAAEVRALRRDRDRLDWMIQRAKVRIRVDESLKLSAEDSEVGGRARAIIDAEIAKEQR